MNIVREVGAYAGFAAFVGMGVLTLLVFTQARDVRRLREWAGGAPERDAEVVEVTSEVAAERAEELRRLEGERKRKEESREVELRAANLRETRRQRREAGLPEQTLWERIRERLGGDPAGAGSMARNVLVVLAVVLVAAGVTVGALHFLGGNDGGSAKQAKGGGQLSPGRVEVAVLNGTATPDLASRFSDKISGKGFQIGAVTNSQSSFAASVVMFKPGFKPEAQMVAKDLKISKVRPMTGDIASTASTANVAVVIGENDANGPAT